MNSKFYQKMISSKSRIAMLLRTIAWILLILAIAVGVVESFADAEPVPLFLYTAQAAVSMLALYTIAAVLHYLAEITDILRRNADRDTKDQ